MARMSALDFKQRRIQHRWTQEERMLICCMKRFFDLRNKDMTRIFNYLYERKIREEGFSNGLPTSTIVTQWEDIRRKHHSDFNYVHREVNFLQGPTHLYQLFEKIRLASQRLEIGLVSRARDLAIDSPRAINSERRARMPLRVPPTLHTHEQRVTISRVGAQIGDQTPADLSSGRQAQQPVMSVEATQTSDAPLQSVNLIRSYTLQSQSGTTQRQSRIEAPARPNSIPTLLWRFSNDDSMGINHRAGYIANSFINEIGNIPPPEDRAQEFPTWLEIHVRPRKIPSPFISTSTDPLVPIHRALTRGKNAFVSLIDPTQINPNHIFYMSDLMKQYKIYTPGYRGAKEYVIWGAVGRGAIVLSFRADQLIAIADEHPDIKDALQLEIISSSPNCKSQLNKKLSQKAFESDLAIGKTIGKFLRLLRLQQYYINEVALALNISWEFTSSENAEEFLRGMNQGYEDTDALPVQSQTTLFHSQLSLSNSQESTIESQEPATQSQNRLNSSPSVESHEIERDYVIVDLPQNNNVSEDNGTIQDQQLRHSIDRLSIYDERTETSVQNDGRSIMDPSPRATTVATRRISLFNPESESWVSIHSTPDIEPVIQSVESDPGIKAETLEESAGIRTPRHSPKIKQRSRSESVDSVDSDATLREQTPRSRLSRERSHVDRVLGIDWQGFFESMQEFS